MKMLKNYFDSGSSEKRFNMKTDSYILEKLLDLNSNVKGNPYVGQDKIGENKFIINKVKILNHRWIIADFGSRGIFGR
jgi:hypothetical protein